MFAAFPETAELRIRRRPSRIVFALGAVIADGSYFFFRLSVFYHLIYVGNRALMAPRIPGHTGAHMHHILKNAVGRGIDMPFTGHIGFIALILHQFAPCLVQLLALGPIVFYLLRFPNATTGNNHRPGGYTDRPVPCAHVISMGKDRAILDQAVEA